MSNPLTVEQLESLWLMLAENITEVGPERESVFLAKLVLLLANQESLSDVQRLIQIARQDL